MKKVAVVFGVLFLAFGAVFWKAEAQCKGRKCSVKGLSLFPVCVSVVCNNLASDVSCTTPFLFGEQDVRLEWDNYRDIRTEGVEGLKEHFRGRLDGNPFAFLSDAAVDMVFANIGPESCVEEGEPTVGMPIAAHYKNWAFHRNALSEVRRILEEGE